MRLRNVTPKSLFGRMLAIILVPIILVQIISVSIFSVTVATNYLSDPLKNICQSSDLQIE